MTVLRSLTSKRQKKFKIKEKKSLSFPDLSKHKIIESNLENNIVGNETKIWLNRFLRKNKQTPKAVKAKTPMQPAQIGI